MSVRFMSTHVVNTLSFVYVTFSHRSGIVEKKIVAMTFAPTFICRPIIIKNITLTKMVNKFQFLNKTGQRGVPTKSFETSGQQVEKRYCPGQSGTSGHFNLSRTSAQRSHWTAEIGTVAWPPPIPYRTKKCRAYRKQKLTDT